MKPQVLCLPGSVAPARQRYGPLIGAVGDAADLHVKDLEVYREEHPPAGYGIEMELEGIDRLAESLGLARFHLVGYSGGGFCCLAYAGTRPERLLSLAVFEGARIRGESSAVELDFKRYLERELAGKQGGEFMSAFVRAQVKAGAVLPPPPASVSPEMAKRPAGIAAMMAAFDAYTFDRDLLRRGGFPVYYAYGEMSHDEQAEKAGILAQLFPDIHVQRFAGVHHFVPPEELYTDAHARALQDLWRRTEG
jgi:pimeloyl-ACP methyl ester carboxylesterase